MKLPRSRRSFFLYMRLGGEYERGVEDRAMNVSLSIKIEGAAIAIGGS